MKLLGVVAGGLAVGAMFLIGLGGGKGAADAAKGSEPQSCISPEGVVAKLDATQTSNARTVIEVGRRMEIPVRGWVIALATALQESSLRNVNHGDVVGPDSRGLFQQRENWGPVEIRLDPAGAAGLFYRKLLTVENWKSLPITDAAQAVQNSAIPDAYSRQTATAISLVRSLAGVETDCVRMREAADKARQQWLAQACSVKPDPSTGKNCLTPRAANVFSAARNADFTRYATCSHEARSEIIPKGKACDFSASISGFGGTAALGGDRAYGDRLANWVVANADQLGVAYVIWYHRMWLPGTGWGPYLHPYGETGPNAEHTNHVHVSVI